ncbi:MAG: hypothetical protein WBB27_06155 [Maribacter sp.]
MKKYLIIFFTLIIFSCQENGLKYEEIDFETRKIVLSSWSDFENPTLTRKSETEKKLHYLYELKIKEYQEDLIKNMDILDSLNNHKEEWFKNIEKWQKEREEKAKTEAEKENLHVFYPSVKSEFEDILRSNQFNRESNKRELDSISALYKKISQDVTYHEINYEIRELSKSGDFNLIQNLRVWVDKDSNVFDHLFLDLPQRTE